MHPIKFTSKLKSLYQKEWGIPAMEENKANCSKLHVYTCDVENADEVLNGGKPHTSVADWKIRALPLQRSIQNIYPCNQTGKNQTHKINDPPYSDCIKMVPVRSL